MTKDENPMRALLRDIEMADVRPSQSEWEDFSAICTTASYGKNTEIDDQQVAKPSVLYITSGICADRIVTRDGQVIIGRFFQPGDFCAATKLSTDEHTAEHTMLAATQVKGVLVPMDRWIREFFDGCTIGKFARIKMFEAHNFDIDVMRVKTINRTHASYDFLMERQSDVLKLLPQRVIAQFLGITPEGFSRFLKVRSSIEI
ncbi:MAG: hypothetical protein AAF224_00015 [Pseudomonadota bacterium]